MLPFTAITSLDFKNPHFSFQKASFEPKRENGEIN
jgi:hypothetical protein